MSSTRLIKAATAVTAVMGLACSPSDAQQTEKTRRQVECLDKHCPGDVEPARNVTSEVAFKLNGQWYIGPKVYGNPNFGAIAFYWPSKAPGNDAAAIAAAKEVLRSKVGTVDNFYDIAIEIFLRSNSIPSEPHGYRLIELAQANGWIASRRTLRPGLDVVKMKHVLGPSKHYIDRVTYYVATSLKGLDGLPPVATCNHDDARNSGGTGFMLQPGVWVGTRMNQRHCADWPEIYLEISRVLRLIRKA